MTAAAHMQAALDGGLRQALKAAGFRKERLAFWRRTEAGAFAFQLRAETGGGRRETRYYAWLGFDWRTAPQVGRRAFRPADAPVRARYPEAPYLIRPEDAHLALADRLLHDWQTRAAPWFHRLEHDGAFRLEILAAQAPDVALRYFLTEYRTPELRAACRQAARENPRFAALLRAVSRDYTAIGAK